MKKIILLFVCFALFLCGCGDRIPKDIHKTTYGIGQNIVGAYDDYVDGKISKNELHDKFSEYDDQLNELVFDIDNLDEIPYSVSNSAMESYLLIAKLAVDLGTETELEEAIDNIKRFLKTGEVKFNE